MFGIDLGTIITLAIGILIGGILFNKDFRYKFFRGFRKFLGQVGTGARALNKTYTPSPTRRGKQPTERTTVVYIRPGGGHYHITRACSLLSKGQFEELGYQGYELSNEIKKKYKPCSCFHIRMEE